MNDALLLELAATWELQAATGGDGLNRLQQPARETLRACADALRMLTDASQQQPLSAAPAEPLKHGEELNIDPTDVRGALKMLYEETADYIRLNNLGGINNHSMQWARAALATTPAAPAAQPAGRHVKGQRYVHTRNAMEPHPNGACVMLSDFDGQAQPAEVERLKSAAQTAYWRASQTWLLVWEGKRPPSAGEEADRGFTEALAALAAAATPAEPSAIGDAVAFLEAFEAENHLHERQSVGIQADEATYFDAACKTSQAAHAFRRALASASQAAQQSPAPSVQTVERLKGWTHEDVERVCVGLDRLAAINAGNGDKSAAVAASIIRGVADQHFAAAPQEPATAPQPLTREVAKAALLSEASQWIGDYKSAVFTALVGAAGGMGVSLTRDECYAAMLVQNPRFASLHPSSPPTQESSNG